MSQKFIAVHAIQMAVLGELTTIKPSFPLVLSDEKEISKLLASKAIRLPEENEMRLFKDSTPAAGDATLKPAAGTVTDLGKLKKAELVKLAADEEIEIDPAASNAVIIKSIEDGRKSKAEETDGLV